MGDTEYLISCIEAHPCVWDPTLPEYHDRERKEAAWLAICRAVIPRWDSFSEQEMLLRRLDLKKKWSNCRDYYKKDMQRSSGSSGAPAPERRRRRYVFAEHLRFLDKVIKGPQVINEALDDEQKSEDILILEVGEGGEEMKKMKISNKDAKEKTKKSDETFNEYLNIANNNRSSIDKSDDDEKYLLSFRSEMQRMTHAQKIDFKLGMMQLVKNIFQEKGASTANPASTPHLYLQGSPYNDQSSAGYVLEDYLSD